MFTVGLDGLRLARVLPFLFIVGPCLMLARGLFNVDQVIVYCWVGWLTCCKCAVYVSLVPLCGSAMVFWFGYISFLLGSFFKEKHWPGY